MGGLFEKIVSSPESVAPEKLNIRSLIYAQLYKVAINNTIASQYMKRNYLLAYKNSVEEVYSLIKMQLSYEQIENYNVIEKLQIQLDTKYLKQLVANSFTSNNAYLIKVREFKDAVYENIRATGLIPSAEVSFVSGHGEKKDVIKNNITTFPKPKPTNIKRG